MHNFDRFEYDQDTGYVTLEGVRVGCVKKDGYRYISVGGHQFLEHRVIWKLLTGNWPEFALDHINGVRSDNRLSNLREATYQQNQFNTKLRKDSSTGIKGVSLRGGKFRAYIHIDGKQKVLGSFENLEDAVATRSAASAILFGEFERK